MDLQAQNVSKALKNRPLALVIVLHSWARHYDPFSLSSTYIYKLVQLNVEGIPAMAGRNTRSDLMLQKLK